MHTSPTASLGQNGNGGLNVYVREVSNAFSERGIATDIFTRMQSSDDPNIESLAPLSRVIYLPAGRGLDKYSLYNEVPAFAAGIRAFADREQIQYDLLYSHYWLSGEVACLLRPELGGGWAHIAHTLGLVKNRTLASGARPEPAQRIRRYADWMKSLPVLFGNGIWTMVIRRLDDGEERSILLLPQHFVGFQEKVFIADAPDIYPW